MKEKMFDEEKVKTLLSLLEYLKKYLPFDLNNKCKDIEVYAFIRLFQKLGGSIEKVDGFISIPKSFEISLRLLNCERVVLKEKKKQKSIYVIGNSPHVLMFKRHHMSSAELAATCDRGVENIFSMPNPIFDDVGFTRNPKTKMKIGNRKIPKQRRR